MTAIIASFAKPSALMAPGIALGHEAAIAAQARQRALDHPAPADHFVAAVLVGAFDDLDLDRLAFERIAQLRSGVAAIREDLNRPGFAGGSNP